MRTIKNVNYVDYILPEAGSITYQALPPETLQLLRTILAEKKHMPGLKYLASKHFKIINS